MSSSNSQPINNLEIFLIIVAVIVVGIFLGLYIYEYYEKKKIQENIVSSLRTLFI